MNKLLGVGIFIVGAAIGSFTTWKCLKTKYEEIAQEEIDSVKQMYLKKEKSQYMKPIKSDDDDKTIMNIKNEEAKKEDIKKVNQIIEENNYARDIKEVKQEHHYIIRPDELGEYDDYDVISLVYYDDHILADENNEIVEDIGDKIGFESLEHFGEYEADSVFVRNDQRKCDYEILLDSRTYSEAVSYDAYCMEDE